MKKSDIDRLYKALGQNLHLLNTFLGDEVHGERVSMSYEEAREIYFLLKSMQTSNSIIWEDEDNKND